VSSITTGTQGAGKGKKYGTATVTILDNLGQPTAGVSVDGSFTGSWNESVTGVTSSDGTVTFITSTTLSGGVQVNFCVNSVNGSLPLDTGASSGLCQ